MSQEQRSKKPNDQIDDDEDEFDEEDEGKRDDRDHRENDNGEDGEDDENDSDTIKVLQEKIVEFEEVNRDLKARFERMTTACSRYQQQCERLERIKGIF